MARIKSLYDAIIKTQVKEDQCTNFLVWLIGKLPSNIFQEICQNAGLSINDVDDYLIIRVQYPLEHSRPDSLIKFSEGKYLIIEDKLYPNSFNKEQFLRHLNGGINEFGRENIWLLFLSGDESIPGELDELKKKYNGRIGFMSWKSLLRFFENKVESLGDRYEIIIKEFLTFANHYKLGRLIAMTNEEIKEFLAVYPTVAMKQEAALEKFSEIINNLKNRIIIECEELVEENKDDMQKELPCLYRTFKIKGWHMEESSGYIFINILQKKIGIMLTGYEAEEDKTKFLHLWNENYKEKYKEDTNLCAFAWVDKGKDEYAINEGYFKVVEGTSGKIFNPTKISEFTYDFYWGYVYELDIEKIQSYYETIPKDFKKLLETFLGRA